MQQCPSSRYILSTSAFAFDWPKVRQYSDAAQARIQEGLPLQVSTFSSDSGVLVRQWCSGYGKSRLSSALHRFLGTLKGPSKPEYHIRMAMLTRTGSAIALLLAYAATNWPVPSVIPPGWSASWKHWDYLLTLFALSPYFFCLPQVEMLVNVKYAIPGQVRPIIYSDARECVLFWTEIPQDPDEPPDAVPDGAGHVFLNCRTFELYTYDGTHAKHAHAPPDTVKEILLLVAGAPTPEGAPMLKLEPDAEGEAALQRILDRDASIIPLLESDFLGYAPAQRSRTRSS
ncbi:hypothetical protein B0H13DRAFT_514644 [Mycena leptocephala]|nr:hypothetical protein B0H13DRAFT_514644 [Mycena leptocephala]